MRIALGALLAAGVWVTGPAPSLAQGALARLEGRSIRAEITYEIRLRDAGGATVPMTITRRFDLYLSTQRRMFARIMQSASGGRRPVSQEFDGVNDLGTLTPRPTMRLSSGFSVEGDSVAHLTEFPGAFRLTTLRLTGPTACTVSVAFRATRPGEPIRIPSFTGGEQFEVLSTRPRASRCSVINRNIFATE